MTSRSLLVAAMVATLGAGTFEAFAGSRLTYMVNDEPTPVRWSAASMPVNLAVGAPRQSLGGEVDAVARAAAKWNEGNVGSVRIATKSANATFGRDGVSAVSFRDDLFSSSGFIAFTTTWFDDTGRIDEADIQVDGRLPLEGYDVEAVVQHELGHLLGLDHSAVLSAAMYPFVPRGRVRLLDHDDRAVLSRIYAQDGGAARLEGEVRTMRGPVMGAHVVAVDGDGRPAATDVTDEKGRYLLEISAPGTYHVYAEPLDGPVEPRNLSAYWRQRPTESFRTRVASSPLTLRGGEVRSLDFDVDDLKPGLNPKWIGAFPAGASEMKLTTIAEIVEPGRTVRIAVGGDGIVGGLTEFTISNPAFRRVTDYHYMGSYLWAEFAIAPDAPLGSVNIEVRNGSEMAMLTGALRVEPAGRQRGVRR